MSKNLTYQMMEKSPQYNSSVWNTSWEYLSFTDRDSMDETNSCICIQMHQAVSNNTSK